MYKRLKKTAIPHIFFWSKEPTPAAVGRRKRAQKRLEMELDLVEQREKAVNEVGPEEIVTSEDNVAIGSIF